MKLYVARDKDKTLTAQLERPVREKNYWAPSGGYHDDYGNLILDLSIKLDPTLFPHLSWEDEPIECELTLTPL